MYPFPTKSELRKWAEFLHMGSSKYNDAPREKTEHRRDPLTGDLRLYYKGTDRLVRPVRAKKQLRTAA